MEGLPAAGGGLYAAWVVVTAAENCHSHLRRVKPSGAECDDVNVATLRYRFALMRAFHGLTLARSCGFKGRNVRSLFYFNEYSNVTIVTRSGPLPLRTRSQGNTSSTRTRCSSSTASGAASPTSRLRSASSMKWWISAPDDPRQRLHGRASGPTHHADECNLAASDRVHRADALRSHPQDIRFVPAHRLVMRADPYRNTKETAEVIELTVGHYDKPDAAAALPLICATFMTLKNPSTDNTIDHAELGRLATLTPPRRGPRRDHDFASMAPLAPGAFRTTVPPQSPPSVTRPRPPACRATSSGGETSPRSARPSPSRRRREVRSIRREPWPRPGARFPAEFGNCRGAR